MFEWAAHPFYRKPKLRIPDVYETEDEDDNLEFGRFPECALAISDESRLVREVREFDARKMKGLGPAAANLLDFPHPTLFPPFNAETVRGSNALFRDRKPLGSRPAYLEMREVIKAANAGLRPPLSTDLGAFAGLPFDVGVGEVACGDDCAAVPAVTGEQVEKAARRRHAAVREDLEEASGRLKPQFLLATVGRPLGYDVHAATSGRGRGCVYEGTSLSPCRWRRCLTWAFRERRPGRLR